ncbi:hypothetical protein [Bacillus solimangrovi]|uniref:Uncharacterized protein n=1 Tax=Bacillus solimangrovi TaxID=1305675 RepID=A0A1E5LJX4_9BACI|nr:hypothetical protein [Bacillus solimangrovi]OEH94392.1 hypothetical protein BFG57_07975 [Bacillus solimangrovi]
MKNVIEAVEFKLKSAKYHYHQSLEASSQLNKENIHIFISEFCAMMEVLQSGIEIASSCALKQSAVDVRTFEKSMNKEDNDKLKYIKQFLNANQKGNVFEISDNEEVQIIPIPKRNKLELFEKRNVLKYMNDTMTLSEKIINDYMEIYEKSATHFDQSWRTIDVNRTSFLCKECGKFVTKILNHVGNLSDLSLKDGEPFISRREYVYGHELIRADILPVSTITEDEVIVPINMLYFDAKKEPAIGCCGPDASTFNIYCRNGHAVGMEAADCWMPHFVRIPLDKVTRREVI